MSAALEALHSAVQDECLPGVWSKGVALARDRAVLLDSENAEEIRCRIAARAGAGTAVAPQVTLWPSEQDWFCNCGDRNDPCAHVAAAVIAAKSGALKPASAAAEGAGRSASGQVLYQFSRTAAGELGLERAIARAEGPASFRTNLMSLIGGIQSGRIAAPPVAATQADFAVDRVLGPEFRGGPVAPQAMAALLKALEDLTQIVFQDAAVRVSGKPVEATLRLEDEGRDFILHSVLQSAENTPVEQRFRNGAVLCSGGTLRPLGTPPPQDLPRRFRADEATVLVTQVIPRLRARFKVEVLTERLPHLVEELTCDCVLEMHELAGETLVVVPKLVYGSPPIAEVQGDTLRLTDSRLAPRRDEEGERMLTRRLQAELHLSPGNPGKFQSVEAARFREKARELGWKIQGAGAGAFSISGTLVPRIDWKSAGKSGALALEFLSSETGTGPSRRSADPARVFKAWERGESLVPLLGGGFAPLPMDWLEKHGARIRKLLQIQELREGRLPAYFAPEVAGLAEESTPGASPARLKELLARLADSNTLPAASLPADLRAELRPYQRVGVNWLAWLCDSAMGALLADDMGLGKTLQALCAIRGRTLIVAPTSVLQPWVDQAAKFRPALRTCLYHGASRKLEPDADVVVTSYAILRVDLEPLLDAGWKTLVLDEAQTIRNPQSQIAQAAYRLSQSAGEDVFRLAMSGTPIENRLSDLWSVFQFINPGYLGSLAEFEAEFASPLSRGDAQVAARLRRRVRPFILRRLKAEVATDLPPRTEVVLQCELSAEERETYEAILAATREQVLAQLGLAQDGQTNVLAALEALLRLRQACCDAALVPGQSQIRAPEALSSKIELLVQTLENAASMGHRALVFSQWTGLLDRIEPALERAGLSYLRLDGSTPDRARVVSGFQDPEGPPVMLISLKAGGVGLTLTAADHIYLMDPWWNPAAEDQASDRAHRIGQTRPVFIHRLVARDTIEERILLLQAKKRELAGSILADGSAAASLTREDLLALLG